MVTCGMRMTVMLLSMFAVVLVGCAKRPAMSDVSASAPTGVAQAPPATPAPPPAPVQPAPEPARPTLKEFEANPNLKDIHFDFDKSTIRPGDAQILNANARWLGQNPNQLVLLEGHCDERGTDQYNLALGDRRANAAKDYLVARGVRIDRITIISYGKERPVCTEHAEACWSKNRRVHFLTKPGA